jgi:hypothetical protein
MREFSASNDSQTFSIRGRKIIEIWEPLKVCFDLTKLSLILELSVPDQISANKKSFRVRIKKIHV